MKRCILEANLEGQVLQSRLFTILLIQERSSSPLQFGQEENIPGHSTERKAYRFVLKIARVLLIPTGTVGIG